MDEAGSFLLGFVAIMIGMFTIWVMTGGPARYEAQHQGALITFDAEKVETTGLESHGTLDPIENLKNLRQK